MAQQMELVFGRKATDKDVSYTVTQPWYSGSRVL